jgi:hypothetical protein
MTSREQWKNNKTEDAPGSWVEAAGGRPHTAAEAMVSRPGKVPPSGEDRPVADLDTEATAARRCPCPGPDRSALVPASQKRLNYTR